MRRTIVIAATAVACVLAACARPAVKDPELHQKLDAVTGRLAVIEQKLDTQAARADREVPAAPRADQGDTDDTQRKLDMILVRLETLEKRLDSSSPPPPPPPPARRQQDPAAVYAVDITGDPYQGPEFAKVTLVMATEFLACPFCQKVRPTIEQLTKDYGKDLKVVVKHFVVHPQRATGAALAACAAQQQQQFFEYEALLGQHYGKTLDDAALLGLARELKLDERKFSADAAGEACKADVIGDQQQLSTVGVRGIPAFFVNGRPLSGARPIEQFKALIDEELAKADAALKKGVKLKDLYRKTVLEPGLKELAE